MVLTGVALAAVTGEGVSVGAAAGSVAVGVGATGVGESRRGVAVGGSSAGVGGGSVGGGAVGVPLGGGLGTHPPTAKAGKITKKLNKVCLLISHLSTQFGSQCLKC